MGFVLFFCRPRSGGWPHHGRTFSIYICPLSFWLTLLRGVLSTYWCCTSRPCVFFLACLQLALFLALTFLCGWAWSIRQYFRDRWRNVAMVTDFWRE